MSIFRRAAMREFASTAGAISVALLFILMTVVLIRLLAQAAGGRVPADALLALIGFSTLNHLPIVLALASFVAVLMSMGRSYRDSEMAVWFASGVPLTAWIWPTLRFVLPVAAVVAGLSFFLSPWAQQKAAEYRKRLDTRDEVTRVAPGVFRESVDSRRVFFVETLDEKAGRVRNVFISAVQNGKQNITVAAEGTIRTLPDGERFVVLQNGRRYEGEPGQADYRVLQFERYLLRIEPKEMSAVEHTPAVAPTIELFASDNKASRGELVRRIGLPVATILLALLAIPLSFANPRAGRTNNLIFAVLIFTVYFNLLGVAQAWVTQGKLGPNEGTWGVHGVMLLLLLLMFFLRLAPCVRRK
ncbi:LPS export ABC transporter permease LptF [Uliginosibacterium sediminicola]|uniref:Lipopolysaccharide export system permease protein LptF n=1 Tax=Uliginosibacterium sediminicola TaxID=2024550 RepID=A0ABU9Z1Y1_9RHOO